MAVVGRRVDALVLAYRVDVSKPVRVMLQKRQELANKVGKAELLLDGLTFSSARGRKLNSISFQNDDVRCVFDEQGPAGWNLEVVVRAVFLATHPLSIAMSLADRVGAALGKVGATRLRRADICADFVRFPLLHDDINRICAPARKDTFVSDSKDFDEACSQLCRPPVREHRSRNLSVTGFTIAPGNPLMARIYDKSAELGIAGREMKRAIEHDIWRIHGWDGTSTVVRVEFQVRGEALDEFRMRDPCVLESKLAGLWQTGVHWVRFVLPGSASRSDRMKLDPRWQAVTTLAFDHTAPPLKRQRLRGGATAEHALGAMLSRLAGSGQVQRVELVSEDGELFSSEQSFANSMTAAQALNYIDTYLKRVGASFVRDILERHLQMYGPQGTVARLTARHNSAVARFTSVDDESTRPNPANEGEDS